MWFIKQTEMNGWFFQHFSRVYGKIWVGFCVNIRKTLFLRGFILKPTARALVLPKTVLGIFKIPLRFRDRHVFTWKLLETLNVFNTSTLKIFFEKRKLFSKKWSIIFFVESTKLKTQHFPTKLLYQKPMLRRQIECGVQNGHITKNMVLPVTILFFRKFCLNLITSYKELIWYNRHPNVHIHTFRKRWSFIWG